jgi:hypothetical protein
VEISGRAAASPGVEWGGDMRGFLSDAWQCRDAASTQRGTVAFAGGDHRCGIVRARRRGGGG